MKRLNQYLTESERTYQYTIKIAGDIDRDFIAQFKKQLQKFDPVEISEPRETPIQTDPMGFPDRKNESVTIIRAEFRYPATEPQIQQMAQLLGHNINHIRVMTTAYNDAGTEEAARQKTLVDHSPLLDQHDLEDSGKTAGEEYASQYMDRVLLKKPSIEIPYAAKATPTARNTSKEGVQTMSPMSKIKLPARPPTGAQK